MKKTISNYVSVGALALALTLSGCSTAGTSATAGSTTTTAAGSMVGSGTSTGAETSTWNSAAAVSLDELAADTHYDADDLTWDAAEEVAVTLADGASSPAAGVTVDGDTVTITAAGTYRLSGTLTDGQLVVAAGEEDVVRIILDGVGLSSSTGSPLVVRSANEAIIYLEDGTDNSVADAAGYADTGTAAPNAALYSQADLTIAGTGSLNVQGNYNDGITSKDGLVLVSGEVSVDATDDGIVGKDYLVLLDGNYSVNAKGDGFKSDNEDDDGRGWTLIGGGFLNVTAGDDGIKAFDQLTVAGGTATVADSEEGMEAAHILISGGTVDVTSNDDALNAAGGSSTTASGGASGGGGMGGGSMEVGDYSIEITGGSVTLNSGGDGLDSNGDATISGGTLVVHGPTSSGNGALDVNGELAVDGGTVAAAGSAGMVVTPGTTSTQSGLQISLGSPVPAGTLLQIADSAGNVVASFGTAKAAASLIFSSADIEAGQEYTVYTGGTATVSTGIGAGSLDGAQEVSTVVAGEYTAEGGMGGGGFHP